MSSFDVLEVQVPQPEQSDVARDLLLAEYTGGDLAGRAAVVTNTFGTGRVVYIGTRLEDAALRDTILDAAAAAGVAPVVRDAPTQVEATVRGGYLFLLNHSDTAAATVPATGVDLLTGERAEGTVTLRPLGVAVIEVPRP